MPNNFLALVEAKRPDIESLLPSYMTAGRFFALIRQIEKNPKLMDCTPESLLECVIKAAECGFEIGGPDDHCYLIPYGKQAQLQAGWKGMVYRLVQAHAASHIFADLVREGDAFKVTSGTKRELLHEPADKRGKIIKAYAVAILPNGITDFEVLDLEDIEAIEKAALRISGGKPSPAWQMFRGEMVKKSAIKRLAKRLQGDRRAAPDEIDRLRATMELKGDIDIDRIKQAESANADIKDPPPRHVEPEINVATLAPVGGKEKVKSDADEPIDSDTADACLKAWKTKHKISELTAFLFEHFNGIEDIEQMRKGQVADFLKGAEA